MSASRKVLVLSAASQQVEAAAESCAVKLTSGLRPLMEAGLRPGETLPDIGLFVLLLGRALERDREALKGADVGHSDGRRSSRMLRARRRKLHAELRACLVEIRHCARGIFGIETADRALLGLEGRLAREPVALLRSARNAVSILERAAAGLLEFTPRHGSTFDFAFYAERLKVAADRLEADCVLLVAYKHEGTWAFESQRKSLARHRANLAKITRLIEALLYVADRPLLAERVRFRPRRHGTPDDAEPTAEAGEEDAPEGNQKSAETQAAGGAEPGAAAGVTDDD